MTRCTRGLLVTFTLALLGVSLAAEAPPARHVPRVGVLGRDVYPPTPEWKPHSVFLQELHRLGWTEGENLTMEYRWVPWGQLYRGDEFTAELVRLHVDVIVAQGGCPSHDS